MTCICKYCPAEGSDKCPKKELEDRAYYFRELLNKSKKEGKENDHT